MHAADPRRDNAWSQRRFRSYRALSYLRGVNSDLVLSAVIVLIPSNRTRREPCLK